MKKILTWAAMVLLSACTGSYSFTGGDVGDAKTVSIDYFPNYAELVYPQTSQVFTEALRDIFVQQTPLSLVQRGGDLHLQGAIVGYKVAPVNVQAGNDNNLGGSVAENQLTIEVNVIYTNHKDEKKSFEQRFKRFAKFPANADLSAVQAQLVEQISRELAENILNQSIGSW